MITLAPEVSMLQQAGVPACCKALKGKPLVKLAEIGDSLTQLLNSWPKMAECSWLAILWFPFYYRIWLVSLAKCAKPHWVWVTGMRWSKRLQSDSYRDNHYKHADCSVSKVIDVGHRRRLEREEIQCAWKTNSSRSLPAEFPDRFARARTEEAGVYCVYCLWSKTPPT